ncbi:protein with DOMON-like ligand-binding domain protein [Hyunsoonleella flava]|uniref:Protein with DOMON-like ligand-binding domain protein n=1 Tax=Hyunsoonleella flava TaxID=2527939 RepID=A0A4V2J9S8_9FLAO|nr:DUF5916 domain-containing protein [Hyunsoonleella flava]TBM99776.1 protein with DOMON-like ligand-binding domain protein [Hyunsoonleella flava]
MKHIIILSILFCFFSSIPAQNKKIYQITRTETPPIIDGKLDDAVWQKAEIATGFVEYRPDIGNIPPKNERTEVKMSYDNKAIYVAAYLYDDPNLIMRQFNVRDNFGQADFFELVLNPNNDGINDVKFLVFSSGNQADALTSSGDNDFSWNAVWDSAVKLKDDGWVVEMKIPYRTLRFSNKNIQTWGLQFQRQYRRRRAQYAWNPIDVTVGNSSQYHGELRGLKGIQPPTRLIFYPFTTGLLNTIDGNTDTNFTVGLDVKYGITENFTLDATLIPDFSQAGFDNLELNLGPFELTFSEQRQFFTEGVDLFNKGNLFFSRRVGSAPSGNASLNENEIVVNDPNTVKVLNAVKVSGRTKKGLGIGVFNAFTERTTASLRDTISGETRDEVVEPFSNYNIVVVDKQFNQNSSVSFINTNVSRSGRFRDANVTGLLADITNKRNTYNVEGQLKMSHLTNSDGSTTTGYSTYASVEKTHGNFRYGVEHEYTDTNYDINDIGLLLRNNFNNINIDVSYRIFEPTKRLNNYRINSWLNLRRLASPSVYTGGNTGIRYRATTKSLHGFGGLVNFNFGKQFDYFEPRQENKFFIFENRLYAEAFISSNYNNVFAIDAEIRGRRFFETGRDSRDFGFSIEPRVRFTDKFLVTYSFERDKRKNDRGYATKFNDESIFGERDRTTITNRITGRYNFNPLNALSLTFRHYWSNVKYDEPLFTLLDNGRLTQERGIIISDLDNDPNINFSTWNLDLNYSWQFAPGSFLTALYRNQLFNANDASELGFSDTLNNLFEQPIQHTFSLRIQYFIDYNYLKKVAKQVI